VVVRFVDIGELLTITKQSVRLAKAILEVFYVQSKNGTMNIFFFLLRGALWAACMICIFFHDS